MNLRGMVERDLGVTIEGDYGVPVVMTAPDGTIYSASTAATPIMGRLVYDHAEMTPNGETVIVHNPCLTLRTSTLPRVPKTDEHWMFKVPLNMADQTKLALFFLDAGHPPENGASIGFTRFYLTSAVQS
jgi:hypothetical protein